MTNGVSGRSAALNHHDGCIDLGSTTRVAGGRARHLRWMAAAAVTAATVLSRVPAGTPLCPLRAITGVPCPLCGTTTSVKAVMRLDIAGALAASPAGVAIIAMAIAILLVRPAQVRLPPPAVVAVVMGSLWVFQLNRFGFI